MKEENKNTTPPRKENYREIEDKAKRLEALINLGKKIREKERANPIPFNDFLFQASIIPEQVFRDIYQLFYDMVHHYVPDIKDKYTRPGAESEFDYYDCNDLFVKDTNIPFFADRLFANRLINLTNSLRKGAQNNQILLFEGPPGSGKSTFLNNLMLKLEKFSASPKGALYETYWSLDVEKLGGYKILEKSLYGAGTRASRKQTDNKIRIATSAQKYLSKRYLEFSCPNHDHPILMIPKSLRNKFLDELITDKKFKKKLFRLKEYEWIFKEEPCAICTSINNTLMDMLGDPMEVFNMIHAKPVKFNRQFGEGISVFNPGDPISKNAISNYTIQDFLSALLEEEIDFTYSYLAKTNNGVLALMDIKEHNVERLMKLHGIISDGVHKVNLIEERIKTLFVGLVNPGDKSNYEHVPSFRDRIINMKIPYVLDYKTEVEIYLNKFGQQLKFRFMPHVIENFARIIISTRMLRESTELREWLKYPDAYEKYIDKNLLLLKMNLYRGKLPSYLSETDIKRLTPERRRRILAASQHEGQKGISGRQSINVFNNFISKYSNETIINMKMVVDFFLKEKENYAKDMPEGFLISIERMYDYYILQEIKESIYYYNQDQIKRDIQNYLFAINFEPGEDKTNHYTGDHIEITDEYFKNFEALFVGSTSSDMQRKEFRKDVLNEYISKTLSQDLRLENMKLEDTDQFKKLFHKYTKNLKENALVPYAENDNFRRAISEFGLESFSNFDSRLQRDINLLINNLKCKFAYSVAGAQQVCIYAIDKKLHKKF